MLTCCDRQAATKSSTELTSLLEQPVNTLKRTRSCAALRCLYLPLFLIVTFSIACIVLSTEVQRRPCQITCVHRPNCTALINNKTYITHQGSCSWRENVAQCHCYIANGVVSINPFILLSPTWTLVAVLSGGALALFTLGLFCWCWCHQRDQMY